MLHCTSQLFSEPSLLCSEGERRCCRLVDATRALIVGIAYSLGTDHRDVPAPDEPLQCVPNLPFSEAGSLDELVERRRTLHRAKNRV